MGTYQKTPILTLTIGAAVALLALAYVRPRLVVALAVDAGAVEAARLAGQAALIDVLRAGVAVVAGAGAVAGEAVVHVPALTAVHAGVAGALVYVSVAVLALVAGGAVALVSLESAKGVRRY